MRDNPSIGRLTNQAARLFRRLADRKLAPLGLSSGHLPVLSALMESGSMSQKALTEHAAIEQPTMAATLNRMERDGIIERQADPHDRRSFRYSLTPATLTKALAIRTTVDGMSVEALSSLSEDDRGRVEGILAGLISSLEHALDP